jgi:pyridoxine 4-dehydrogenase
MKFMSNIAAGLTWKTQPPSDEQSFAAMRAALSTGSNFWNGGEFYGPPNANSLHLLNRYYAKYPEDADKVVLSIKGGANVDNMAPNGSPENIRRSVNDSLKALGDKGRIDIFECARVDKNTPLEVTLKCLEEEFVKTGKIGGIGLSEVSAATIRKAAKITKIVAVEVELSLWATDIFENGVAAACAEFNIPIVA